MSFDNLKPCYDSVGFIDNVATGTMLQGLRIDAERTQKEVADAMSVKQGIVSRLECGKQRWTAEYFRSYLEALVNPAVGAKPAACCGQHASCSGDSDGGCARSNDDVAGE
jgi:hypothetical protein